MVDAESGEAKFSLTHSPDFATWLGSTGSSIAFTTYQAGKLLFLGADARGEISVHERSFPRCMGLGVGADGRTLALGTRHQIHRFDNVLPVGAVAEQGHDALYAPHAAWITGDLDVHDVGFGADGRPLFVNTMFGCIASVSDGHSFRPLWQPPFITDLVAEDRCHLNGMAVEGGHPRYATAVSRSNVMNGWRDERRDGGVVLDIPANAVVATGLSMPHSPRLYDDRLWLLESGRGGLGYINPDDGRFHEIAMCPGYARGLAFVDEHAVVGLSLARDNVSFSGLELDDRLSAHGLAPHCGLVVIDLSAGRIVHWVRIEGVVKELYDVAILHGVRQPLAIGFKNDDINRVISIE